MNRRYWDEYIETMSPADLKRLRPDPAPRPADRGFVEGDLLTTGNAWKGTRTAVTAATFGCYSAALAAVTHDGNNCGAVLAQYPTSLP